MDWRQGVEHHTERAKRSYTSGCGVSGRCVNFGRSVIVPGHEAEIFNLGLPSMPHVYIFALIQLLRPVNYGPICSRLAFPAYLKWALR